MLYGLPSLQSARQTSYNRKIVTLDFLGTLQRTHMCGDLRSTDVGSTNSGATITLMGWVNRRRDHGNLIFLDLRDRTGITQVVLDKEVSPEAHAKAEAARPEYVVAVTGKLRQRGPGLTKPNMPTGEVELVAHSLLLLNDAKTPPFPIADDAPITNEEIRLKYRYLDLRRPELQRNFELRHKVTRAIRDYLSDNGFLEIETPLLTRSTPEGARDYLVPSRVHPGHFYALPQSPQIFKQILMVSGFDRYFQIARCFRDEDLRADRQPDFTQIDLEISFPQMSTIFAVAEGFLHAAFRAAGIELPAEPFIQMAYDQAIQRYGIDKPDMRLPAMVDLSAEFTAELRETLKIDPTLPVLGFVIPNVEGMSTTQKKALANEIRSTFGDCGLDYLDIYRLGNSAEYSPLAQSILRKLNSEYNNFLSESSKTYKNALPEGQMLDGAHLPIVITAKPECFFAKKLLIEILAGRSKLSVIQEICKRVGALRLELGRKFADKHKLFEQTNTAADFKFLWVTDFPMYEWNEEHKTWDAAHHPFTSPHEDDILAGRLTSDKGAVRALAYDIVLNGTELGSGSIRIHRKDVQAEIFRSLGMSDEEAKARFGFFLDALEYGTPPHGGIALGLDRIVMILAGASSLREVIAFPKTAKAIDLMVDAPTTVSDQQLRELNLRIAPRS
jgi:aspartyl-tRNA synthetase